MIPAWRKTGVSMAEKVLRPASFRTRASLSLLVSSTSSRCLTGSSSLARRLASRAKVSFIDDLIKWLDARRESLSTNIENLTQPPGARRQQQSAAQPTTTIPMIINTEELSDREMDAIVEVQCNLDASELDTAIDKLSERPAGGFTRAVSRKRSEAKLHHQSHCGPSSTKLGRKPPAPQRFCGTTTTYAYTDNRIMELIHEYLQSTLADGKGTAATAIACKTRLIRLRTLYRLTRERNL